MGGGGGGGEIGFPNPALFLVIEKKTKKTKTLPTWVFATRNRKPGYFF